MEETIMGRKVLQNVEFKDREKITFQNFVIQALKQNKNFGHEYILLNFVNLQHLTIET